MFIISYYLYIEEIKKETNVQSTEKKSIWKYGDFFKHVICVFF